MLIFSFVPPPVFLSFRFKESALFLSPARRTQEVAVWIDDEVLESDAHQFAPGGPACPSRPRLGHNTPPIFDREALRASAHSLRYRDFLSFIYTSVLPHLPSTTAKPSSPRPFNTRVRVSDLFPRRACLFWPPAPYTLRRYH